MEGKAQEKVLVCPLAWGLGHATRCVPIIQALLKRGRAVVVAADGAPLDFLKQEFGTRVAYHRFPGMIVRYPEKGRLAVQILFQLPAFLLSVIKEHRQLKKLIRDTGATLLISDNRYGLWNKKVFSVFMTHQVFIQAPEYWKWIEPLLWRLTRWFIRPYDHCWIPDFPFEPNLSGRLSHGRSLQNLHFIGPLSRFSAIAEQDYENPLPEGFPKEYYLVLLSGPEPQRSLLEEILKKQFETTCLPVVFVLGKLGVEQKEQKEKLLIFNHFATPQLAFLIKNARLVICRSGYSSIMDLAVFGKKALLIPTPGQTEQEYLGSLLEEQGQAHCVKQDQLDLQRDIAPAMFYSGILKIDRHDGLLEKALDEFLKKI
ncbi:MAG: glycosyltransferase [Bacteroides sp.]|nr:glycosyltransferase [Bacteroides sp.]